MYFYLFNFRTAMHSFLFNCFKLAGQKNAFNWCVYKFLYFYNWKFGIFWNHNFGEIFTFIEISLFDAFYMLWDQNAFNKRATEYFSPIFWSFESAFIWTSSSWLHWSKEWSPMNLKEEGNEIESKNDFEKALFPIVFSCDYSEINTASSSLHFWNEYEEIFLISSGISTFSVSQEQKYHIQIGPSIVL